MRRIDLLIISAIGAAVVFSVLGVATYERASDLAAFDVTWTTASAPLADISPKAGACGTPHTYQVDIAAANLTNVLFAVDITRPGPQPLTMSFTLAVEPPTGVTAPRDDTAAISAGAGQGTTDLETQATIQPVPTASQVDAASQEAAYANLTAEYGSTAGTGGWTVTVSCAMQATLAMPTFTSTLVVTPTTYAANAVLSTPDVDR